MDFDELLTFYFGTAAIETLDDAAFDTGLERLGVALGTERDSGRRFALWTLMHALGAAPDPEKVFKDAKDRKAAEDYAWAAARIGRT
ncbi:MAG: hypothetical protein ACO1O3_02455 [Sphingobium sp.]